MTTPTAVATRYLTVRCAPSSAHVVAAYLYSGQKIVSTRECDLRVVHVVELTAADEDTAEYRADYVTGRLASGMFFAEAHHTRADAEAAAAALTGEGE